MKTLIGVSRLSTITLNLQVCVLLYRLIDYFFIPFHSRLFDLSSQDRH